MSASAGLRQRLSTMLFTLWPKISSEPLAGSMLTVTPALRAMSCPQMPPALTTTCARYSAVWPGLAVEHLDARDAVLFAQKVEHLVVGQHLGRRAPWHR